MENLTDDEPAKPSATHARPAATVRKQAADLRQAALAGEDAADYLLASLRSQSADLGGNVATDSVTASYLPSSGTLSVVGSSSDNAIAISRDASGALLVNSGAVAIRGGTATVANTALIQVFGQAGNDSILLNELPGALPRATLFGGRGDDVLQGGSGADMLFGQSGNDTLLGKGGVDLLFGGSNDDVLTGGDGNDQVYGESGNDRMVWNPGDDSDLMEGGDGIDTVEVNGGGGNEVFTATANGTRIAFDRLDPAPFALDIGSSEILVVRMNGGNDRFSSAGNLSALIQLSVDGGAGDDTILGGNGIDRLLGGDGDDFVDGQQGNDVVFLGAGRDTFQWDPGDGSDTVDGQDGDDAMVFNGSAGSEILEASAIAGGVRFTRNIGAVVMDLHGIERIDVNALANTDTIVVGDLSGTDVTAINVNLAGVLGTTAGDGVTDTVITNGTNGDELVDVFGSGTSVSVVGLAAQVNVTNNEGAFDSLVVGTLGGKDRIAATTLPAGVVLLTIDAGAGDDTLLGSQGADVLLGGDGDDLVLGDAGSDLARMGAGDDVFQWDPGDGSDTIEGQAGIDRLMFSGSNASEAIDIVANGGRALLVRNIGTVTLDMDDVEQVQLRAFGASDNIVVGDLTGTDLTRVDIDLSAAAGGGDGVADTVTVNASQGADVFGVFGSGGGVGVFGLHAGTNISFQEQSNDRLVLNALGGDDIIDATQLERDAIRLTVNGGLGVDVFLGSEGGDVFNGGDGNDLALGGAGDDVFAWNPGDDNDVFEGQAGNDRLLFNGANVAERINLSANGGRANFSRDVAAVTIDLATVEGIEFKAMGGADTITIDDLSATDVTEVNLDLGGAGGGGDAAADTIIVNATLGDDLIVVVGDAGGVTVLGLAAQIHIANFDPALDRLQINGLGGSDVIEASGLMADSIVLWADGGDGDDVLIGGDGNDVLLGGAGDDVLLGGPGIDVIDGGTGTDIEIQLVADEPVTLRGTGAAYEWLAAHSGEIEGLMGFDTNAHESAPGSDVGSALDGYMF